MPATVRSAISILFLTVICLSSCQQQSNQRSHLPSADYRYAKVDTASLHSKGAIYAPVYSHIYTIDGTRQMLLAATLSVRNTSLSDSFFVTSVIYYGSQGEQLKQYLQQPIVLRPMASVEFVVERDESKGGAGANFVIHWGGNGATRPLVQTVMTETTNGISFVTDGVEVR
jgi:hypothetical protein